MNFIEARLQEMRDEARNELITRIAVHEAGHFVMMLLVIRSTPYHVILMPKTGAGMSVPIQFPDSVTKRALIMMAGYTAEKLYDLPEEDTPSYETESVPSHNSLKLSFLPSCLSLCRLFSEITHFRFFPF